MSEFLLQYKRPDPVTWVYLSSFLTIGLFFAFHRFWSLRNLDLILLILLAPGLLLVHDGRRQRMLENENAVAAAKKLEAETLKPDEQTTPSEATATDDANETKATVDSSAVDESAAGDSDAERTETPRPTPDPEVIMASIQVQALGYVWLLSIEFLILMRLIFDSQLVRRPLLDPNLTSGGMMFLSVWLFLFMMANVLTSTPRLQLENGPQLGPGYSLMKMLPAIPTRPAEAAILGLQTENSEEAKPTHVVVAKVLAISAHLAILIGIISIGYRHFNHPQAGIGCALLYLLMPYTAQMTGRVDHALPAALLIWAILCYRRPYFAGLFLGATGGLVYYPMFLLPLWLSFYWQRGVGRFALGALTSLSLMIGLLVINRAFASDGADGLAMPDSLGQSLVRMFGLMMPPMENLSGIWGLGWEPMYRLPILVAFLILSGFLAIWPAQKNLGTLIGCTGAVMVGAQFWHAYGGGLYIAWFLPLLLLTIFRPNLEDRVALKVIDGGRRTAAQRPRVAVDAA